MASILTPGYLRWDGTKYVLDGYVEIVGPEGDAGPTGPTGLQGVPGSGTGASATGDISGIYPGAMSVVGLTGVSGVVSFGTGVTNPTITQTTTAGVSGQPMTLKGQNAVTTGGDVFIQSGTGTTAGVVRFLIGNTLAGYFDSNKVFRAGLSADTNISVLGGTLNEPGNGLYSYNASGFNTVISASGAVAAEAQVLVLNSSAGASLTTGLRLIGAGATNGNTDWVSNGVIEQVGGATSALVLSSLLGNGTSRSTSAKFYRSGAVGIGSSATNNTSALAQAGLTGPVINLAAATGTFTSAANQALNFNIAGAHHIQGHTDVRFDIGAALAGYFDVNRAFRTGVSSATSTTILNVSVPTASDTAYSYNASGDSQWRMLSGSTSGVGSVEAWNSSAGGGTSVGMTFKAAGASHSVADWQSNGIIEQIGSATSSLVFSKQDGAGLNRATTGRIFASGAWGIGSTATNNTSTTAQAGLTGPVLNIGAATGSFTTAANQALNFNIAGSHHIQGHTDVRFDVGSALAGYFDSNRTLRIGPDASIAASVYGATAPTANNDTIYSYSASTSNPNSLRIISNATTSRAIIEAINTSAGASSTIAIRIQAGGSSDGITSYAGNGAIEQVGSAISSLVFGRAAGDLSSRSITGRIYQSGAWGIGDAANNNTSALAQAGLTGTLLNLSQTTGGAITTATNQATMFNVAGQLTLQGNTGVTLLSGTTNIASTTTTKLVTTGRRLKVTTTTIAYQVLVTDHIVSVGTTAGAINITLPLSPTTGDTYTVKDANGSATANNITILGNGNNIDATTNSVISTNYGTVTVVYNGSKWITV